MSLFKKTREIAIDLGTANTIISVDGKIVVEEPSVVVKMHNGKFIASGYKAGNCSNHYTNPDLEYIEPLKGGDVNDYEALEYMISSFLGRLNFCKNFLYSNSVRMRVCAPPSARDSVSEILSHSKIGTMPAEYVQIVQEECLDAALGMGVDCSVNPSPFMMVDIGGTASNISVFAEGAIKHNHYLPVGDCHFADDIRGYLYEQRNIIVVALTAEQLKRQIGVSISSLDKKPDDFIIQGRDPVTFHEKDINITPEDVTIWINKSIDIIEDAIRQALEPLDLVIYNHIVNRGIHLTGGGALLRGLADCLSERIGIKFVLAEDPLHTMIKGIEVGINNSYRRFYADSDVMALREKCQENYLQYLMELHEDASQMMSDGVLKECDVKCYYTHVSNMVRDHKIRTPDYAEKFIQELKEYSEKQGYNLEKIFGK